MQTIDAYKSRVRSLSFSSDGTTLASAGGQGRSFSLWNLGTSRRVRISGQQGRYGELRELAFASSGTALATLSRAGISLWRDPFQKPGEVQHWPGGAFAFRGDGAVLALREMGYGHGAAQVRFERVDRNEPAGTSRPMPQPQWGSDLAWSPAGPVLAATGRTYETTHIHLLRPGLDPDSNVRLEIPGVTSNLTFSPDGRTLAVASTRTILRWDVETASVLPALKGHDRMVNSIGYLPDGRLLSASNDGTVRTWDGNRCVDVKDWQLGELSALAVARDGMRAAVGNKIGTILIWDID
jgi:WD40 repeat protein